MIMRMSSLFVRTLREDPADAEVPSHRLLVRAGYIRRAAPGIYTWLPLGLKVLRKIEGIIREEMDGIGAQELSFPALLPREPYEATGRWTEYGPNIFRLQDRKGNDYLLGPTHEEMFTLVVKDLYCSYKDLPLSIYQIQTKYRDEARPRAGLLRGREFIMKDSYSFDVDDAGLEASYQKHRDAYIRIFDRLGFEYVIVSAMSGAMGGSKSEEFLAAAENGEDTYVRCTHVRLRRQRRGRARADARARRVRRRARPRTPSRRPTPRPSRPWSTTSTTRSPARTGPGTAADTLKNVIVVLRHPDGVREPLAIGVPGDREVDQKRLEAQVYPAEVEAFDEKDFAAHPMLAKGYIGPGVLGEKNASGIRYLVDPRIVEGTRWVTGADVDGSHVIDLVAGRDFTPDGTIEAAEVREGDPCPNGDGTLQTARGIEMGHIFAARPQVRRRARPQGARRERQARHGHHGLLRHRRLARGRRDRGGHPRRGRAVAGPARSRPPTCTWSPPARTSTCSRPPSGSPTSCRAAGIDVLFDDRLGKVSPGVKFKDAELIGVPTIVVVGKDLATDGTIEVKDRASRRQRAGRGRPRSSTTS